MLEVRTLTDGGQRPVEVATMLGEFLASATSRLDLALYDLSLSSELASVVREALSTARTRGARIRLAYNQEHRRPIPVPPPPSPDLGLIASLGVEACPIPGVPDLMHHKYVIRDGESVWTGSTNWRDDSWAREENVIVLASSVELAGAYEADFEQLWKTADVARSGRVDPTPLMIDDRLVRPWFTPGRADSLVHRIAGVIGQATRRVRVCSPVLTSAPILATLVESATAGRIDLAGALDATQMREVLGQWARGPSAWKTHLIRTLLARAPFAGKVSTPYAPGSVHDFMHAKIVVADDVVFAGSYNLSHSGEMNAENVLEIEDARLAERMAAYVDGVRARYSRLQL